MFLKQTYVLITHDGEHLFWNRTFNQFVFIVYLFYKLKLQPIKFEESVKEIIHIIKELILTNEIREGLLLENSIAQKELEKQIESIVNAFHSVLKNLAINDNDEDSLPIVSQLIGTPTSTYRTHDKNRKPSWEQRLLITLANCQYTITIVIPNITKCFSGNGGYILSNNMLTSLMGNYDVLEKYILDAYLERKSDPLVGTIEPSMYLGKFDWDTDIEPTDTRPYVKECINNLIHVHSEVCFFYNCMIALISGAMHYCMVRDFAHPKYLSRIILCGLINCYMILVSR